MGYTLELPWRQNQRGISCIPLGVYPLRRARYHAGDYDCWEICEVYGRDEIKIHVGNTIDDIQGCVVLGGELGWVHDRWAVTVSKVAFRQFMRELEPCESATVVVLDA